MESLLRLERQEQSIHPRCERDEERYPHAIDEDLIALRVGDGIQLPQPRIHCTCCTQVEISMFCATVRLKTSLSSAESATPMRDIL